MGSLNYDGTQITQSRKSVKKIGRGHVINSDRRELSTFVGPSPVTLSTDIGTEPNLEVTQRSIYHEGILIRTTQSLQDLDVDTNTNRHAVVASEQPELDNLDESRKEVYHTGNKVVVVDSLNTSGIESRKADTGAYHSN
jgi:hypothetical protein